MRTPTATGRPVRVTLVENSELVWRGLHAMLETVDGVVLVPHRRRGGPQRAPVDITLVDPGRSIGVQDLRRLMQEPDQGRLVLYAWELTPHAVQAGLQAGVAGCLSKSLAAGTLAAELRRIHAGEVRVRGTEGPVEPQNRSDRLTTRELEVIGLIAGGAANGDIAADLGLSINSIKSYIRSAYRKIGVSSRSQAVLWAVGHGHHPAPSAASVDDPDGRHLTAI